jgi:hypothetical protein
MAALAAAARVLEAQKEMAIHLTKHPHKEMMVVLEIVRRQVMVLVVAVVQAP